MRNLSILWFLVLTRFKDGNETFICNTMNRLRKADKISKLEAIALAKDLYSQPDECFKRVPTDTMRAGTYGALWGREDNKERIQFMETRIKELEKEETANVEAYM